MLLLGLDLETTGLNPTEDRIIEVGAVLWETDTQTPILVDSFYVDHELDTWNKEAEAINGISEATVKAHGMIAIEATRRLDHPLSACEYIVAHNGAAFDRPFLEAEYSRQEWPAPLKPWIDTQNDIEYPEAITTRKLVHLAAEHGFLNPFPHRAVFDVLTMLKVLSCYDIQQVIAYSLIPTIKVRSLQKFDENELAKARGFRWDGEKRIWWRTMKQSKLEALQAEAPFKTTVFD